MRSDQPGNEVMGKRKKKKKRNKRSYSKNQFIEIVCGACKMCDGGDATFCHKFIYRLNPSKFMGVCYGELLAIAGRLEQMNILPVAILKNEFERVFCWSGICNLRGDDPECKNLNTCMNAFKQQVQGLPTHGVSAAKAKKRKRQKNKKTYVCKAYPTFFVSESMKKEVEEILHDNRAEQ